MYVYKSLAINNIWNLNERPGTYGHESNKIFYIPLGLSMQTNFLTDKVSALMDSTMSGNTSKTKENTLNYFTSEI